MLRKVLPGEFYQVFGMEGGSPRYFFAPGRFNLIGEHTDYNGGHVLPCAIDMGIYTAARKRDDDTVRLYSAQKESIESLSLADIDNCKFEGWIRYPLAVVKLLRDEYQFSNGIDIYFNSTLPPDSGLSSSAAIEAAMALAVDCLMGLGLSSKELALICHRAENEIVGVRCGIMDQFAVFLPKKDHALLLSCEDQQYSHIPIILGDYSLVLVHSETYRSLDAGLYNQKRLACEESLKILGPKLRVSNLCAIDPSDFEKNKHLLPPELESVARHPVYEEARVKEAVRCLQENDLACLGRLLFESHLSLKEDYQVTNKGLDTLYEEAKKLPEVLGARMTGAGFGGCTINIVKTSALKKFEETVSENYERKMGLIPSFYPVKPEAGAREIDEG